MWSNETSDSLFEIVQDFNASAGSRTYEIHQNECWFIHIEFCYWYLFNICEQQSWNFNSGSDTMEGKTTQSQFIWHISNRTVIFHILLVFLRWILNVPHVNQWMRCDAIRQVSLYTFLMQVRMAFAAGGCVIGNFYVKMHLRFARA